MGRGAGKIESVEDMVHELESRAREFGLTNRGYAGDPSRAAECVGPVSAAGEVVGQSVVESYSTFKPIEPSRLTFQGAPDFDPRPYLDPVTRAIFEDPIRFATPLEEFSGTLPRVRVHCAYPKKIQLFKLLDSSRRLIIGFVRGYLALSSPPRKIDSF